MTPTPTQAEDLVLREKIARIVHRAQLGSGDDFTRTREEWAVEILAMISAVPSRDQGGNSPSQTSPSSEVFAPLPRRPEGQSLSASERHELECLRHQVGQLEYPCSPHCEGYLRELALRNGGQRPLEAQPIGAAGEAEAKGSAPDDPPSVLPSDGVGELIERLLAKSAGVSEYGCQNCDEYLKEEAASTLSRLRGERDEALAAAKDAHVDCFDAGLLGDGGEGNVAWWHGYIRSLLDDAHEFYADQARGFASLEPFWSHAAITEVKAHEATEAARLKAEDLNRKLVEGLREPVATLEETEAWLARGATRAYAQPRAAVREVLAELRSLLSSIEGGE